VKAMNIGNDAVVSVMRAYGPTSGVLDVQITSKYTGGAVGFRVLAEALPRILGDILAQSVLLDGPLPKTGADGATSSRDVTAASERGEG